MNSEKKIQLLLKDFLTKCNNYEYKQIYLDIYDNYNEVFQKIFGYFHEQLNSSFDFMNQKSKINKHYNADDSRNLIHIIDELRDLKRDLKNTDHDFDININYVNQIKFVQNFLQESGGSSIPEEYTRFDCIKYEPIFKLKNEKTGSLNMYQSVDIEANFNIDSVTLKINENILKHIKSFLETSHYYSAVEESYKIVRRKLNSLTGEEQAHKAFKEGNYEIIFGHTPKDDQEKDFFEGVKYLHYAIQYLRNEKAHTPAKELDKNLAIHYIVLASLAYDLIDRL